MLSMRLIAIALLLCLPLGAPASTDPDMALRGKVRTALERSKEFHAWLEEHKREWAECDPRRVDGKYVLCDGTEAEAAELQSLFRKKKPEQLVDFLKAKAIKLEVLCKDSARKTFTPWCSPNQSRAFFREVTALHGQFLPEENTILIHSDAYLGSLIHEYLHSLQFKNANQRFGRSYKQERIGVQEELKSALDAIIARVQELEKQGDKAGARAWLSPAVELSQAIAGFGLWQKLIDERNLFRLYILFQKQLGVASEDVALARKNMGFLCKDAQLKGLLPKVQCAAK